MINTSKGRIALILIVFLTMMTAISQPVSASTSYIVSRSDKKYSYTDMKKDIEELTAKYPDRLTSQVLGESADGRNIYALCLGNPEAEKQIFVTAGMHAREYINCQVVMMMVERYCRNYGGKYKGKPIASSLMKSLSTSYRWSTLTVSPSASRVQARSEMQRSAKSTEDAEERRLQQLEVQCQRRGSEP